MAKLSSTGSKVSKAASKILRSKDATRAEKSVAASALTQLEYVQETTSKRVATAAAKILRDPRASKEARSVAAAALTQKTAKGGAKGRAIYGSVSAYFEKKK